MSLVEISGWSIGLNENRILELRYEGSLASSGTEAVPPGAVLYFDGRVRDGVGSWFVWSAEYNMLSFKGIEVRHPFAAHGLVVAP